MQPSNYHQTQTQRFKLKTSCGLAFSGLVFYFAHVLQQAQARDTALMNDPLSSEATLTHDLTDSQAPIAVASVDQLEPVMIESNTSQAVTITLVSDDEEDDQAIEASGKDAIDVPSQGASPLLLLGGVALVGGGIAVLANDDSSSNDNPPEDNNMVVYTPEINDDSSSNDNPPEDNNTVVYTPEISVSGKPVESEIIEVELSASNDSILGFYAGDDKQTLSRIETYSEVDPELQDRNTLTFTEDLIGYDIYAEISNGIDTKMIPVVRGYDTLYMNYLDENLTTSWEEVAPGVYQAAAPAVLNDSDELGVGPLTDTTLTMTTPFAIPVDITEPLFVFRAEHSLNEGDDLQVIVSIDSGATWLSVGDPLTGHNDGNEYTQISLSDYIGEDNVNWA